MNLTDQQKADLTRQSSGRTLTDYYLKFIESNKSEQLGDTFQDVNGSSGGAGSSTKGGEINTQRAATGYSNSLASNVADKVARNTAGYALSTTGFRDMPGLGVVSGAVGDIVSGKPSSQVRENAGIGAGMTAIREGLNAVGAPSYVGGPLMAGLGAGLTAEGTNTQVGRALAKGAVANTGGWLGALFGGGLLGAPGAILGGWLGSGVASDSFQNGFLGDALDAREYEAYRDSLESKYNYDYAKKMVDGFPSMSPSASLAAMEGELGPDLGDMGEPGVLDSLGEFFNAMQDFLGMDGDNNEAQQKTLDIYESHNNFKGGRDDYWNGPGGDGHGADGSDSHGSYGGGTSMASYGGGGGQGADGT